MPRMDDDKVKVPVGTTTIAGYSATLTSTILAVLAFTEGDHTQQVVGTIVAGALAIGSLLVTQLGRYWQAREMARAVAQVKIEEAKKP